LSQFIDEFEKGGSTREERKLIDFFNGLLELGGEGSIITAYAPQISAEERPYLMLMSWASISSVVVMILELAW
jgi:hypothetical protein